MSIFRSFRQISTYSTTTSRSPPFEQILSEARVWAEAAHLGRAWTLALFEDQSLRLVGVACLHGDAAKHQVGVLNGVAVVPVALELRRQRDQFPGGLLGLAEIPGDETLRDGGVEQVEPNLDAFQGVQPGSRIQWP